MEPPLSPCPLGCGRNVIVADAEIEGQRIAVDPNASPDGALVLLSRGGGVVALPGIGANASWRRWHLHQCRPESFCCIDFETAEGARDSACAIGVVRVEGDVIVQSAAFRIRPPRERFTNTEIHGLTWEQCRDAKNAAQVWAACAELVMGVDYAVAYNVAFDRSVLRESLAAHGYEAPAMPWVCALKLARQTWSLSSHKLNDVAAYLGLDAFDHHNALQDATAAAGVLVMARRAIRKRGDVWDWRNLAEAPAKSKSAPVTNPWV